MKSNDYRKLWAADKAGWYYYCQRARRTLKRYDKRQTVKRYRATERKDVEEGLGEVYSDGFYN